MSWLHLKLRPRERRAVNSQLLLPQCSNGNSLLLVQCSKQFLTTCGRCKSFKRLPQLLSPSLFHTVLYPFRTKYSYNKHSNATESKSFIATEAHSWEKSMPCSLSQTFQTYQQRAPVSNIGRINYRQILTVTLKHELFLPACSTFE